MFNTFSKEWFTKHFGEKPSVAIIGNSANLLNEQIGTYIDSYDVVCRMNNYQIAPYEAYVGKKTDLYVTSLFNKPGKSAEELREQKVETVFVSRPMSVKYAYNVALGEMLKNYPKVKDFDPVFVSEKVFDELYDHLNIKNEANGKNPTSGLTFIRALLTEVELDRVFVAGFDFFASAMGNDAMHYYKGDQYDQNDEREKIRFFHPRNEEVKEFISLIKEKENVLLSKGVAESLSER